MTSDLSNFICLNKYKIFLSKKLGDGLTSFVYEGLDIISNEKVAIKVIDKNKYIKKSFIENELKMLNLLKNNNNFIQLIDNFEDSVNYYLVFEYADNIFNHIVNKISKENIFYYLKQLLHALIDMCKLNILHNDIKPSNILIFYDESTKLYNLKISDFGMSEICDINIENNNNKSICGSPMYMNLNKFEGIHNFDSDFWSLKIIYYQMVYNIHPFKNAKTHNDIKLKLIEIKNNKVNCIIYPYEYNPHTILLKRLFNHEIKTVQELLNEVEKTEKEIYINDIQKDISNINISNNNINSASSSIIFINIDMPESTYDVKSFDTNISIYNKENDNKENDNNDSLFDFILF
jgi:serine/threonine protein kinase